MGDEERNSGARNLGFLAGPRGRLAGVPVGDPPPKPLPPSPMLDKFRALLKEREEEFGFSDVPPEEVVRVYEEVLSELTLNSKPIITDLTIIAGEHKDIGEGIADAICARIIEVPVEQKLPSLYLLDSIVKNIGREYVKYFSARLPRTWSTVFPSAVLRRIEAELQFSPSVVQQPSSINALRPSESRPSHGIHVNPKYLEARGQLERSTVDLQHSKVDSSSMHTFGRKSAAGYSEDAYDQIEDVAGQTDPSRIASGYLSTVSGSDRNVLFSKNKMARPSSPMNRAGQTLSPLKGSFSRDISPGRVDESVSPLHSKLRLKGEETADWLDRTWSADGPRPMETSRAYNLSKGNNQRPRALIDAYGSYREKPMLRNEFLKGERYDLNGGTNQSVTRNWQSVEEEEYDWEDMSPTLADRSRGTEHRLIAPSMGGLNVTTGVGRPLSGSELRRRDWNRQSQLSLVGDSVFAPEDRISSLGATGGATIREDLSTQNEPRAMLHDTSFSQDSWNLHQIPQTYPSTASRSGRGLQMPLLTTNGNIPSASQKILPLVDNPSEAGFAIQKLLNTRTGIGSSPIDSLGMDKQFSGGPYFPPHTSMVSKNVPASHPFPSLPSLMPHRQMKSHLDLVDSGKNVAGLVTLRPPNQARENIILPNVPSQLVTPITNRHVNIRGQEGVRRSFFPNPYAGVVPSIPPHSMRGSSVQVQGGALPPLPPGPPPVVPQLGLSFQNTNPTLSNPPPGGAFSGLIGSLMAQGLISLTPAPLSQDSLGVEFDVDLLKVRHDSAIDALYVDLPRQCTTCGMRFKSQEEHRSHMDWHVTKNRVSKNRKQNPSRKWFVSTKEWLSGAETLGTDIVPGFLPTEAVVEKRVVEEMAVPADENQNVCALCGDPFEDFYSDETDEWMYRGAVYMNAADGQVDCMDRSQLGPIVHAKCRSESTGISSVELTQDEVVSNEEHSQRKRMRSSI